jgi:hypothetical protein
MTRFFGALAIVMLISGGIAPAACLPSSTAANVPSFPVLPPGSIMYYCAASQAPQNIGDLTYAGWAKHVQVCTTQCSYELASPSDPYSPLIATRCGPGWHAATYLVEPPPAPAKSVAVQLKTTTCSGLVPSKAPPQPAPSSKP